jgi:phosphate acetyltransferase
MDFLSIVKRKATQLSKRIVYPETFDERTLRAIEAVLKEKTARPVLLGKKEEMAKHADELKLEIDWSQVEIIDPADPAYRERYAKVLYEKRKDKGMTPEEAAKLVQDINYFGVLSVEAGDADGLISGANSSTADTVRPALQIIGTKERFHKVSGIFFMLMENRLLIFADCAINVDPNSHELAEIAIDTAETAKRFGIEPKIAMLSFSTAGSAKHPFTDKVREATQMVRYKRPEIVCDGEMQVDAALVPEIAARKFPKSLIKGDANIMIFPDLQAGNISYKLVERLAKAKAIGPILQGLNKPVNDLSRGCSWRDIADLTAMTACECAEVTFEFGGEQAPKLMRKE